MRVVHLQIFAAAMAIGFVGAGLAAMSFAGARRETERKLGQAQADLKLARDAAKKTVNPLSSRKPGRDLERENADFAKRVRDLETEVGRLKRENEELKKALGTALAAKPAAEKPVPGSAYGSGEAPPEVVVGNRDLPPPPPPQTSEATPWGASEDSELDEMAAIIKLNPEQREQVKKFILEGQNEFEQRLIDVSKTGERDILVIERIGEEVSQKTQAKIDQILFAEQKSKFADLMKRKKEGQ